MSISNHLSEEQIAQCADAIIAGRYGGLDSELRNHLTLCDDCASEVLSVTDIALDYKTGEPRGKLIQIRPWIAAVMGAAAVGLIFFVAMGLLKQPDNTEELATLRDSATVFEYLDSANKTEPPLLETDAIAEVNELKEKSPAVSQKSLSKRNDINKEKAPSESYSGGSFVPDQTLEILFGNFTQAYRGEDIVILSSGITEMPGSDSLKWSNPSNEELYIEFFDNSGNRFLTLTERSSGVKLPELDNGLYYWKLINQDFDLLFVGKIMVE